MSVTFTGVGVEPMPITFVGMYSDGTPIVKTDQFKDIRKHADTMILRADSMAEFVVGMFLYDALDVPKGQGMRLVMPYLPGARQDRSNPTGDVLFTARSVANMINERNFSEVVSIDPHSTVMPNLINNFREFHLARIGEKLWKGYGAIISPDKGAKRRAKIVAKSMGLPVVTGSKVRDVSTGRLSGFDVTVEAGKHYLVVDDICDGGGTFLGLGEKIREQGAYADLYVTHGIFSNGTSELKTIYKNIYTTNSRYVHERNDVSIIDIMTEMENY